MNMIDVPKRLRELADQLEDESICTVDAVVVVNRTIGEPLVVYVGQEQSGAHLLLHVGAQTLVNNVLRDRY